MVQHKTSAWPLALSFVGLVVYASLYPFSDWRNQGIEPWAFLASPWPKYWTSFDVVANVLGYLPLGFLLTLAALRSGSTRYVILRTSLLAGLLSLVLETLQSYLPARVPSNVDLLLNVLGAGLGAVFAAALEWLGALDRWSQFRRRWFIAHARGGLVLLALWPLALLFPAAVPLGLGQVLERVETGLAELLQNTPFLDWIPLREIELQPMLAGAEVLCVMLGALMPCLLGFSIIPSLVRRAVFLVLTLLVGIAATALSSALSYGPSHAWAWFTPVVQLGLAAGLLCAVLLLPASRRVSSAWLLLALGISLGLLNQASSSAYFSHTLQTWEQGRFIRFHGLAQWLGWLWPYLTLVYVVGRMQGPETKN